MIGPFGRPQRPRNLLRGCPLGPLSQAEFVQTVSNVNVRPNRSFKALQAIPAINVLETETLPHQLNDYYVVKYVCRSYTHYGI